MEFSQFAVLLSAAAIAGITAKIFRQPLIIGYLLAGFLLVNTGVITDTTPFEALGKIGVTLLLFLVGLEMNLSELPSVGKTALITGLGQIFFTSTVGFLIASALGFGVLPALYIAIALTFSSTIIIIKLLSQKKDLSSLYGRISVGFLLVQDLVAILILMFLASLGEGGVGPDYFLVAIKGIALLLVAWFLSRKVFPTFFARVVDRSTELVFVVSIAWALGAAAFVDGPLGFSLEIGGFLAGITLSNLPDHLQIATRTRPLRDFFLTLFFLLLGGSLVIEHIGELLLPAVLLSAFVLIGNPIIVVLIMGVLGYRKRTSFMASVTVAQISEFSLILMAMGLTLGHVTESQVALIVLVGAITMTSSTYLILKAEMIYERLSSFLSLFERKQKHIPEVAAIYQKHDHIVLVGAHRTGRTLIDYLKKHKKDFVVVDFDPDLTSRLQAQKIPVVFGDISEDDILEAANIATAKLVISTTPDLHDNLSLLSYLDSLESKPPIIVKAAHQKDATILYEKGATYVMVPEVVAGEHLRHLLINHSLTKDRLSVLGESHKKRLQKEGAI